MPSRRVNRRGAAVETGTRGSEAGRKFHKASRREVMSGPVEESRAQNPGPGDDFPVEGQVQGGANVVASTFFARKCLRQIFVVRR